MKGKWDKEKKCYILPDTSKKQVQLVFKEPKRDSLHDCPCWIEWNNARKKKVSIPFSNSGFNLVKYNYELIQLEFDGKKVNKWKRTCTWEIEPKPGIRGVKQRIKLIYENN